MESTPPPVPLEEWKPPPELSQLELACTSGKLHTVHTIFSQWLAKQNPDPEKGCIDKNCFGPALNAAVINDHPLIAGYLLSQGLRVNIHLVQIAIYMKSCKMLQIFLDYGWNINEPIERVTPPALMLVLDNADLTKWFLAHHANPDAPCGWDYTPLSTAILRASFATIKLLFKHGGTISHGQLLHYAAAREASDRVDVLTFLLELGTPVNEIMYQNHVNNYHEQAAFGLGTPLHKGAELGRVDVVEFLLSKGADPSIKDSKGRTAFELAEHHGHVKVLQRLRRARDINVE